MHLLPLTVLLHFPQPCPQSVEIQREPLVYSPSSSLGTNTSPAQAPAATTASCGAPLPAVMTTTASGASVLIKVTQFARGIQR